MKKTFTKAMLDFFGTCGRTALQFAAELRSLSHPERLQFHAMLLAAGIECDPPAPPKVV